MDYKALNTVTVKDRFPLPTIDELLDDLQSYLNKFEPSYYTKNGKDPLVYPYILLLSIQLLPAVLYLSKEAGDEGYNIDAAHLSIVLADHGVLSEGAHIELQLLEYQVQLYIKKTASKKSLLVLSIYIY